MYSREQAKAALSDKAMQEAEKRVALWRHQTAIDDMHRYNLPYRIVLDYLKGAKDRDIMDVPLNPYYPFPGIPKEFEPPKWSAADGGYSYDDWISLISKATGKESEEGISVMTFDEKKIREWQRARAKPYKHIWDLDTEQGRQKWLYYFAVFIMPYRDAIPLWGVFDMFGDSRHTQEQLNERKGYYTGLIKACDDAPGIYKHEVQKKQLSDYDRYSVREYMWRDTLGGDPEPPQCAEALAVMYKERERCFDYDTECRDRHSKAYRIKTLIDRLESGQTM